MPPWQPLPVGRQAYSVLVVDEHGRKESVAVGTMLFRMLKEGTADYAWANPTPMNRPTTPPEPAESCASRVRIFHANSFRWTRVQCQRGQFLGSGALPRRGGSGIALPGGEELVGPHRQPCKDVPAPSRRPAASNNTSLASQFWSWAPGAARAPRGPRGPPRVAPFGPRARLAGVLDQHCTIILFYIIMI